MRGANLRFFVLVALLCAGSRPGQAGAQALPFHTTSGITAGFQENAARTFLALAGRSGLVRDGESVVDPEGRDIDVLTVPVGVIAFAPAALWTVRAVVPYADRSLTFADATGQRRRFHASGIGDVLVDTKYIFFSDNRAGASTRLGVQAGVELPVGQTDAETADGEVGPRPLQVGSGSFDFPVKLVFTDIEGPWGFHANAGWRFNTADGGFKAGDRLTYDLAVGYRLLPGTYESLRDQTLVLYLELNGEVAREDRVNGRTNADSGGHLLFLSPDLQWVPAPWLLFEASLQLPVLQDLGGTQLEHEARFQLGTRVRFSAVR